MGSVRTRRMPCEVSDGHAGAWSAWQRVSQEAEPLEQRVAVEIHGLHASGRERRILQHDASHEVRPGLCEARQRFRRRANVR